LIDTEDFNYSTYIHVVFESMPNLIIQSVNSHLLGTFNSLSIISITFSAWQIFATVFPLLLLKATERTSVKNIPLYVRYTDIKFLPYKKEDEINFWLFLRKCLRSCFRYQSLPSNEDSNVQNRDPSFSIPSLYPSTSDEILIPGQYELK
jgi:hypothetical protein